VIGRRTLTPNLSSRTNEYQPIKFLAGITKARLSGARANSRTHLALDALSRDRRIRPSRSGRRQRASSVTDGVCRRLPHQLPAAFEQGGKIGPRRSRCVDEPQTRTLLDGLAIPACGRRADPRGSSEFGRTPGPSLSLAFTSSHLSTWSGRRLDIAPRPGKPRHLQVASPTANAAEHMSSHAAPGPHGR
jgi:hypothetical protein